MVKKSDGWCWQMVPDGVKIGQYVIRRAVFSTDVWCDATWDGRDILKISSKEIIFHQPTPNLGSQQKKPG